MPRENEIEHTGSVDWQASEEYSLENLRAKPELICEVTEDARDTLREWGLSDELIDELAQLSAKYDYDSCLEKMEQIAQRGGIITRDGDREAILLPDYFDLGERSGGQCGEIAAKVVRDLHADGWLQKANDKLGEDDKQSLYPYLMYGNSRTHFNQVGQNHVWAALGPRNAKLDDLITVDGSFLEISRQSENGYRPTSIVEDPQSETFVEGFLAPMGDFDYDANRYEANFLRPVVVGVTNDRSMVVMLGFVIDRATSEGEIRTLIQLSGPDGISKITCIRGANGISWHDPENLLTESLQSEVTQMLEATEQIEFTEDKYAAENYRLDTTTIRYRE